MKRGLFFILLFILPIQLLSQKAEIRVVRTKNVSVSEWQVLDDKYMPAVSGKEYPDGDTISFTLMPDKRYFFLVSVSAVNIPDASLYALYLNGDQILMTKTNSGTGDFLYPFFTGTKSEPESKITGGSNADISDFPWQVYIEALDYSCGGTIIDNQWVLTAAHCTRDEYNSRIPASEFGVIVGANNPRNTSQGKRYLVSEVFSHESYDVSTYENDIALLKLAEPLDYANAVPIKLVNSIDAASGVTDPGVLSWVTGYGITSVSPVVYPATLQKVQLPIVSNLTASAVWKNIAPTVLMAGYQNLGRDACIGDSGGPLVVPFEGGYKLAGIVSWGSSECDTYGGYTRVSLFETWITQNSGIEVTFIAPVPQGDSIVCFGTLNTGYQVPEVQGATGYTWSLEPENAGTVSGNSENAIVTWDPEYKGLAKLRLQVARGSELSYVSKLNVNIAGITRIISGPSDTVLCAEKPLSLIAEAEGYNLSYNWYRNTDLYRSGPSGVIDITSTSVFDSGQYYCEVTGACGNAATGTSSLTVLPVTRITNITPDKEVDFGTDLTLEVNSEGHELTYQWLKDGIPVENGNAQDLVLKSLNANKTGLYQATVTGTCGIQTSQRTYLYVRKQDYAGEPDVFIWPTAVNEEFSVAVSNEDKYTILIYNSIGSILMKKENCQYQTLMNISNLPDGLYIVSVINDTMRKSSRIIKR